MADAVDAEERRRSPSDRIIEAAYACFDRFGIGKTTVEDISAMAKVSRPTFYRCFANKDDVIAQICLLESIKVTEQVRRRVARKQTTVEYLTEILMLVVRIADENPYVQRLLSDVQGSHAEAPQSALHQAYQQLWGGFLVRAIAQGDFASDLTLSDISSWLTTAEKMLLRRVQNDNVPDDELRRFIRRFIVQPLLPPGPSSAPSR